MFFSSEKMGITLGFRTVHTTLPRLVLTLTDLRSWRREHLQGSIKAEEFGTTQKQITFLDYQDIST